MTFLEYNWQVWRFKELPPGFWIQNKKFHRIFFDYLASTLNISNYEQWYSINKTKVEDKGLIFSCYQKSLTKALQSIYPGTFITSCNDIEHKWELWRFLKVPVGFWKEKDNQRAFFDSVSKTLQISHWEDWYHVKKVDVEALGGGPLLSQCFQNSLTTALMNIYSGTSFGRF